MVTGPDKLDMLTCPLIIRPIIFKVNTLISQVFLIASENAKFSQLEVNLGLIAGWGGTQRLTRLVGWRKAKERLLTGVEIDGSSGSYWSNTQGGPDRTSGRVSREAL